VNIAVVGAGLAGLAAACDLAELGYSVAVFERRPWAGGKTYSHTEPEGGPSFDNGQHVFMGCTTEYQAFLQRLGTLRLTRRQRRLRVQVRDMDGHRAVIAADPLPAPFHLARSFAGYRHLTLRERLEVARALAAAIRVSEDRRAELGDVSFHTWLLEHGQSASLEQRFWDFLLLPTLNCRAAEASARDALFVLQEGFLKSSTSAAIGVASVGLSELHVKPAIRYIEARGGTVATGAEVVGFETHGSSVVGLRFRDGGTQAFDGYVCAVPHTALPELLPRDFAQSDEMVALRELPTAPIINLHCWFDRPVAGFAFAAFVGCELQWVFNRDRLDRAGSAPDHHVVVSLSGAQQYMALTKRELQERFLPQLRSVLPEARDATLLRFAVIKEPEATFVPAPGIARPSNRTPYSNLVLAGAYTATGWPATMESAVRSGRRAAGLLHQQGLVQRLDSYAIPEARAS